MVACGLATLDVVQYADRVPARNEKIVAESLLLSAGGPALNAAVTAVALGAVATLVTGLGSGTVAEVVRADLDAAGVRLLDLAPADANPPVSTVLVLPGGDRSVVSVNATGLAGLTADDGVLGRVLDDADVLLVDGHHMGLARACAAGAALRGIPVVLDGGSWKAGTRELLAHVSVAALSADFTLDGRRIDELDQVAALGPAWVVRTHGPRPVEVLDAAAGQVHLLDVPAREAVDTLGAGDVFHGALAAAVGGAGRGSALALGEVLAAVRDAIDVAGRSVEGRGARLTAGVA